MPNEPRMIELGDGGSIALQTVVGYYTPYRRMTESGLVFMTYFGLRQYIVTGGYDERLLELADREAIMETSRERRWRHVEDLRLRLMATLVHNVRLKQDLVFNHVSPADTLIWTRESNALNDQERMWLGIVRSVVGCN